MIVPFYPRTSKGRQEQPRGAVEEVAAPDAAGEPDELGPEGVEVKPVVDVTKVTLAALAVFAATAALSAKLLKR